MIFKTKLMALVFWMTHWVNFLSLLLIKSSKLVPLLYSCVNDDIKQIKTHPMSTKSHEAHERMRSEKNGWLGADRGCRGGLFRGGWDYWDTECVKKRRCYGEYGNHLINQEKEAELSPADVQSKLEQLWVLHGGPNPLVAPPRAWKPGGESPFVCTKATLTRFHCDKEWEGCFWGGAEKLPTRGANKMPIHLPSFTLIPRPSPFLFFVCSTTKQQTVRESENTRIYGA